MNARTCKRIRGLARARSVGLPEREYEFQYFTRAYRYVGWDGKEYPEKYEVYTARLSVQSTRGLYRAFKKAYRRAAP